MREYQLLDTPPEPALDELTRLVDLRPDLALPRPQDLAELVERKGLAPGALVIEVNQRIIKQEEWAAVRLEPGDRIELLSFVGGG